MTATLLLAAAAHPWLAAVILGVFMLLAWSFHPIERYKLRHIPGPPPRPFVGNALELKRVGQVDFYSRCAKQYGKVFKLWLGNRPVVVVSDASAGKKINLRNPTRHPLLQPMTYSKFGRVAGKGLFVAGANDTEAHRELKTIWLKVFNSASLAGFVDEMALGADVLCSKIQRAADDAVAIDVWRALGAMTMDVVAKCAFGLDLKTQQNEGAEADERAAAAAAAAAEEKAKEKKKKKKSDAGSPLGSPKAAAAAVAAATAAASASASVASDASEAAGAPEADADAEAERDLLARSMLSSARTIFATGSTSSVYGLLAMALPEFTRPLLRVLGTLFPGKVLRDLEGARATMLETSLALTRAARARVEAAEAGSSSSSAPPPSSSSRSTARGVAKGAFPELFLTASRAAPTSSSGEKSSSAPSPARTASPYDDITIAAQCQTFLLAGYETTATTLAFCVHWLAAHPEAAAKLARELDDAAAEEAKEGGGGAAAAASAPDGSGGDVVDAATAATSIGGIGASRVARLPYLDAVLKEVMRLTPAAPITLRVASQDQVVSVVSSSSPSSSLSAAATKKKNDAAADDGEKTSSSTSFLIPKGTWIHVDSFHISRDPSVWGPDALAFRPERWLAASPSSSSSASEGSSPSTLQTWAFGDGNLACVGRRLAEWESKLTLAALFRRFEFRLEKRRCSVDGVSEAEADAPELECRLTLGPKAGVRVIATARGATPTPTTPTPTPTPPAEVQEKKEEKKIEGASTKAAASGGSLEKKTFSSQKSGPLETAETAAMPVAA